MKGDRSDYANISDFAARDLNVKYYIISPPSFWSFQKNIEAQVKGLWKAPGLTPVYKDGATAIFAVNAQLTDEELAKARENGEAESPDELPPLPKVHSGEDSRRARPRNRRSTARRSGIATSRRRTQQRQGQTQKSAEVRIKRQRRSNPRRNRGQARQPIQVMVQKRNRVLLLHRA
nr:hypothetical protein [Corynebacterium auriscanis]